jgi:hypothetical protein
LALVLSWCYLLQLCPLNAKINFITKIRNVVLNQPWQTAFFLKCHGQSVAMVSMENASSWPPFGEATKTFW